MLENNQERLAKGRGLERAGRLAKRRGLKILRRGYCKGERPEGAARLEKGRRLSRRN